MPPSLLVDAFEIRVPQQACRARKRPLLLAGRSAGRAIHHFRPRFRLRTSVRSGKEGKLLTKTRLHRNPLASFGAAARDDRAPALGFHSRAKAVRFRAAAAVGLKCALGHETWLLLMRSKKLKQEKSINDGLAGGQTRAAGRGIPKSAGGGEKRDSGKGCGARAASEIFLEIAAMSTAFPASVFFCTTRAAVII